MLMQFLARSVYLLSKTVPGDGVCGTELMVPCDDDAILWEQGGEFFQLLWFFLLRRHVLSTQLSSASLLLCDDEETEIHVKRTLLPDLPSGTAR